MPKYLGGSLCASRTRRPRLSVRSTRSATAETLPLSVGPVPAVLGLAGTFSSVLAGDAGPDFDTTVLVLIVSCIGAIFQKSLAAIARMAPSNGHDRATMGTRYFLRQLTESQAPNLFFLAHNEIPPGLKIQSLGTLG